MPLPLRAPSCPLLGHDVFGPDHFTGQVGQAERVLDGLGATTRELSQLDVQYQISARGGGLDTARLHLAGKLEAAFLRDRFTVQEDELVSRGVQEVREELVVNDVLVVAGD